MPTPVVLSAPTDDDPFGVPGTDFSETEKICCVNGEDRLHCGGIIFANEDPEDASDYNIKEDWICSYSYVDTIYSL